LRCHDRQESPFVRKAQVIEPENLAKSPHLVRYRHLFLLHLDTAATHERNLLRRRGQPAPRQVPQASRPYSCIEQVQDGTGEASEIRSQTFVVTESFPRRQDRDLVTTQVAAHDEQVSRSDISGMTGNALRHHTYSGRVDIDFVHLAPSD